MSAINVTVSVPMDALENALYSASQGCAYWADRETMTPLDYESDVKALLDGSKSFTIHDAEEEADHILTREKLVQGIVVLAKTEPQHFADLISEEGDMNTADALIQCALFGEVKYS